MERIIKLYNRETGTQMTVHFDPLDNKVFLEARMKDAGGKSRVVYMDVEPKDLRDFTDGLSDLIEYLQFKELI